MRERIHAVDAIRGFCLVNIFINHVSAGVLTRGSFSNLGLSDSADLFVLLAGTSTVLAASTLSFRQAVVRFWRRAATLYLANMALVGVGLIILIALAGMAGSGRLLDGDLVVALQPLDPLTAAWQLVTLQQSVGYSMVLRLYVALMLLAPVMLWLTMQRWWLALPLAAVIWIAAGQFRMVATEGLTGLPLTLTILPWILVFTCGMAMAGAYLQGVRIRQSPRLLAGAVTIVAGYVLFLALARHWPEGQAWLAGRNDHFWLGASKTYQSPLRILHLLALAYIFTAFPRAPLVRLIHAVSPMNPLTRLGRCSLPVFLFSAMVAVLVNELVNLANLNWGVASPQAIGLEVAMVGLGLLGMFAVARVWSWAVGPSGPAVFGPRKGGSAAALPTPSVSRP